MSDVMQL